MPKRSSDLVVAYIRGEYSLLLGPRTATEVVSKLVRQTITTDDVCAEVRGRDLVTGLPKTIVVSGFELRDAIRRSS